MLQKIILKNILYFCLATSVLGCSVYRSQGRKSFETDTPARVPISLSFECKKSQSPDEIAQIVDFNSLMQIPDLKFQEYIFQNTVILLASSTESGLNCFSQAIDYSVYTENPDLYLFPVNTWP